MASFDFMTDDELRASLEDDARQMNACLEAGAYKAAQVMAGSVVEALLVDYLIGLDHAPKKGKAVLEMTLGELLAAARAEGVVSTTTADLGSVIRDYRNLIHPGRVKRLAETVDDHTARIAKDLVEIIVKDVARGKKATYGYTANQIVKKVESDSSSASIIGDLLRDTPPQEIDRLLLRALPKRYLELAASEYPGDAEALPGLRRTYHAAMDGAPDEVRRRVMERYVKVLKEQPEFEVLRFEEAFFRGGDLDLLTEADARTAKAHLVDQVARDFGPRLEGALTSFGKLATRDELKQTAAAIIQYVAAGDTVERRNLAEKVLRTLWVSAPPHTDAAVPEAIASWEQGTGPEAWKRWLAGMRRSLRGLWDEETTETTPQGDTEADDLPF
jgi:hypothetical protein